MEFVSALVGLLASVFVNAAINGLPRTEEKRPWFSRCPRCLGTAEARELLPLVGHIVARGRCRRCGESLPWRNLLVELLTAGLLVAVWLRFGQSWLTLLIALYMLALEIVLFTDLEHRIIPNTVVLPCGLLALGAAFFLPNANPLLFVSAGALAFALALLPALLGGFGFGDVKLAGVMGLMTGFPVVIVALGVGILLGGVGAAGLLVLRKKGRRDYIPYGPYLVGGALVALFFGQAIWDWYILRL